MVDRVERRSLHFIIRARYIYIDYYDIDDLAIRCPEFPHDQAGYLEDFFEELSDFKLRELTIIVGREDTVSLTFSAAKLPILDHLRAVHSSDIVTRCVGV